MSGSGGDGIGGPRRGRRVAGDGPAAEGDAPDLERLAEDWIALWQSELAGLAADPEWAEACRKAAAFGSAWARGVMALATPPPPAAAARQPAAQARASDEPARADAAKGAAADRAAPRAGDGPGLDRAAGDGGADTLVALRERIAELESRLAALERGSGRGRADRARPRRRRPSA